MDDEMKAQQPSDRAREFSRDYDFFDATQVHRLMDDFARESVAEFIRRVNSPTMVDMDFDIAAHDVFREMFGEEAGD